MTTITTEEIYAIGKELTDKEINNVLGSWDLSNEKENIDLFESLVRLGDSRGVALMTTIAEKYKASNCQKDSIYGLFNS